MLNLSFINFGSSEVVLAFLIWGWSPILLILYCCVNILKGKFKDRITKLSWLAVVLLIPVIGAALYMVVGKGQKVSSKLDFVIESKRFE